MLQFDEQQPVEQSASITLKENIVDLAVVEC
jgi:hypothetical protein